VTGFSHIVSLGYRCRTTQRLRDHFGCKTAFPFDWWITPLTAAAAVLRDWDAERLYDPRRLRAVHRWTRRAFIEQVDYRVRLQHEFPMDEAGVHVLRGWRDHIEEAKARTVHLMAKFDGLDRPDRKVLFVRELQASEETDLAGIAALRQAALDHTPRAQTSFLLISRTGAEAEGWRALKVDDPVTEPWSGTPEIWDAALGALDYRFERREGWGEFETA
jgi:hypothetical protein